MALKSSESPAVTVREIDLTGVVPAVTSTTGAFVGDFNWGPVNTPVLVGTESELASTFGSPLAGEAYAGDFLSVAHFLKYSSSAFVVRAPKYIIVKDSAGEPVLDSDGKPVLDAITPAIDPSGKFAAKYIGALGNTLTVSVCDESRWNTWDYSSRFSSSPLDSKSELHIVVLSIVADEDPVVLETYDYVSTQQNAKLDNGSSNYYVEVINSSSSWIELPLPLVGPLTAVDHDLAGSEDGEVALYFDSYGVFGDKDTIQIDFLVPPAGGQGNAVAIQQELVSIAEQRKDCIAVVSPSFTGTLTVDAMLAHVASIAQNSSYLVVDGNWLKIYDKYNDAYVNIPAASSTAGIMAAGDVTDAPWFSPAGSRRGQYLGVTDILVNPSKTDRDRLYKAGINPIVSFPGQGIMLYGDKTHMSRPSAFDRINVRRLFLVLERAISTAAENVMFELNDEFTRAEFSNIVEPFLREVQGRRGITDFRLVCDETNNTPEVIDRNEFVASCFIKPARSINYVTLNFVAVRTGVEFEEVVGTV